MIVEASLAFLEGERVVSRERVFYMQQGSGGLPAQLFRKSGWVCQRLHFGVDIGTLDLSEAHAAHCFYDI